jgi:SAM-dependent methyltransferase
MMSFDDPAFYDAWADSYDEFVSDADPGPAVGFLADLAGKGRVLELAIGTGRVALPLAARGVAVEGLDASAAMVDRLRAKPGGASVPVTIGDMADIPVSGEFRLVYLVFSTLFALQTQARQAGCLRSTARVMAPGGTFVMECAVPDLSRYQHGQLVETLDVREDSAVVRFARHDLAAQRITTQFITFSDQGVHLRPQAGRYAWPSEIDLMAAQAGLSLRDRFADWDRRPFTSASPKHVSVYQRT